MLLGFVLSDTALTALAADKPNILVIWGDDIGWYNISDYNLGVMGYETPNIDRIANEGALFTDCYGQQSCACRSCSPCVPIPSSALTTRAWTISAGGWTVRSSWCRHRLTWPTGFQPSRTSRPGRNRAASG